MEILQPNHRWQVTWWMTLIVFVQLCASTPTTTCSSMGSVSDNKGDQQIHSSSVYLDLDHPAECSGYISQLHYCYYATNFKGFVGDNPVHQAFVQIWREDSNTGELYRVHTYELSQDTSQDHRDDFICRNETLKPNDYINIEENDVIGVTLPIHTLTPPLQLISTNSTGFGLYLEPLSSSSIKRVEVSSLMLHKELVLHLSADIMTNASFESSVRPTSTITIFSAQTHPPRPPVARMMPQLQTPGKLHPRSTYTPLLTSSTTTSSASAVIQVSPRESSISVPHFDPPMPTAIPQSSSSSPATVSSPLPIPNSPISSVLASPTPIISHSIQSKSFSVSESLHLQPTSTFQTSSFTSSLTSSPESLAPQSSRILHINPSVAFSRGATHSKSLKTIVVTESVQPDVWNPTLYPPSLTPQSSFTPTIIAGIVAIALALATMAGCTLIGCIAIIHCKKRPHRVNGSTVERGDDKDTISLKDDSSAPDTPTNSSSGVSSMHSISELTITMDSSPTTSLTSRGSGFRSRSSTLDNQLKGCTPPIKQSRNSPPTQLQAGQGTNGSTTTSSNTALIVPATVNGHGRGVVPLPVFLIDERNPVSPTDHDYEELASQRNSINEQHLNSRPPIIRTMSGNEQLMSPRLGHRARNNSMPLFPRKDRRPVIDHDYDEPICIPKKTPVYQNGCMAKKNAQNKAAMLLKVQSSPAAKRMRPIAVVLGPQNQQRGVTQSLTSKTKDYEVPIPSADQAVENSSCVATLHASPSLGSLTTLRLNKAKSMRVTVSAAKQGYHDDTKRFRSGSVGMEWRIRDQLRARKSTGSSFSDQDDMEVYGQQEPMDGPYREPPSEVPKLFEFLNQISVENIPPKDINVPVSRDRFGQFKSQPLKSSWRKSDDVTLEVSIKVACMNETISERVKLLQEAAILAQFRHPNVVRLHGITNKDNVVMVVLEHFPKEDLRKFLVQMGRSIIPPDTPKLLLSFSQQVALGMQYLASKGFVHKDLAARNVFVTNNDTCKVGEVWKSKELSSVGDDVLLDKILIKSTAPEAMYHHKYSTASDVWSYGCLLYEIWSLGRTPFKTFTNKEVIEKVDAGYRLAPPPGCPRAIYQLMIQCWNPRPLSRPNFKDILNVLLKDETQTLQIPVKDACTHEAAILLGSEMEAGNYMYTDLQHTYDTSSNSTPIPTSGKERKRRSDYDHITGQNFLFTFPTSSADLESVFNAAAGKSASTVATNSVVPQPSLSSTSPPRSAELVDPAGQIGPVPFRKEQLHSLDSDYEVMA